MAGERSRKGMRWNPAIPGIERKDFIRPKKRVPPPVELPSGEIIVPPPLTIPPRVPANPLWYLLSGLMVSVSIALVAAVGVNQGSLIGASTGLFMAIGLAGGAATGRLGNSKAQRNLDINDYLAKLAEERKDVTKARQDEHRYRFWCHPNPDALRAIGGGPRMWERRMWHEDYMRIRVSRGPQRVAVKLVAPEFSGDFDDLDMTTWVAAKRFIRLQGVIDDIPIAVNCRHFVVISLESTRRISTATKAQHAADLEARRGIGRAMVMQAAMFHGPDDLMIGAVVDEAGRKQWDWLKWLIHNESRSFGDRIGPCRMVCDSLEQLESWLPDELAERPRFSLKAEPYTAQPHLLVIVDGGTVTGREAMIASHGLQGVTIIDISDQLAEFTIQRRFRLRTKGQELFAHTSNDGWEFLGRFDRLSVAGAEIPLGRVTGWKLPDLEEADDSSGGSFKPRFT